MRKIMIAVCALSLVSALVCFAPTARSQYYEVRPQPHFGPAPAPEVVVRPGPRHDVAVNNIFSPFSTIKILGARPGPKPLWAPECNQGFVEWKPVCAVTRNRVAVTYPNQCMAELDGAIVFDDRECPRQISCPYIYEPVCARVNYPGRKPLKEALKPPPLEPFINECFARTLPDRVKGEIPPPEATEELKIQVTIVRNYGDDLFQYQGATYRFHGKSGLEDFSQVCPKSCPEGGLVVCALDHNDVYRLFKNKCSAIMAGAVPLKNGDLTKCK